MPSSSTSTARHLRPRGRARRDAIVAAAREVITDNGYAQLSLRAVAERAGVGLSHLQYHFPTREKLVKALIENVAADYAAATAAAIAGVPDTPTARFMAWIDYLIEDCWQPQTRRFFVQLWGLLEVESGQSGSLLSDFYNYDIEGIAGMLVELSPHLDPGLLRHRATIIAGAIEGMMLMLGDVDRDSEDLRALRMETRRQILRIATEA